MSKRSAAVDLLSRRHPTGLIVLAIVIGAAAAAFWLRSIDLQPARDKLLAMLFGAALGLIVELGVLKRRLDLAIKLLLNEDGEE